MMKMLKKGLCLALAALLTLSLSTVALAAQIVLSSQKLEIDGKAASAQAYNVDGSNYFKLRDLAYLLRDTDARFSVTFDRKANAVRIGTGETYVKAGGELAFGADQSATAVKSPQTVYIDGRRNTGLSAYNIGGSNYFRLRDLGEALGFGVDYDAKRGTMLVSTAGVPADWKPDISFATVDMNGNAWTDACFAGKKLTVINLWAYWCGPCMSEIPDLQKLADNYAEKGVQLLGIGYEEDERDNVKALNKLGVTYPCLRYTGDFDAYLETGYVPVTAFVDGNGKVLGVEIGSRSYDKWAKIVDRYLK